ncbi:hypothetical protein ANTPLA_LOCUS9067 [Anthophora plagiata]
MRLNLNQRICTLINFIFKLILNILKMLYYRNMKKKKKIDFLKNFNKKSCLFCNVELLLISGGIYEKNAAWSSAVSLQSSRETRVTDRSRSNKVGKALVQN